MKKLYLLTLIIVSFLAINSVKAEGELVEINKTSKEVRVTEQTQWRVLNNIERLAYENPGVEQPIFLAPVKLKRSGFLHYIPTKEYKQAIVFRNNKIETINKTGKDVGEEKLSFYIILLLGSIIILFVFGQSNKNSGSYTLGHFFSAVFSALAAGILFINYSIDNTVAFGATPLGNFLGFIPLISAVTIFIALIKEDKEMLAKTLHIIFYVLNIICIVGF